MAVRIATAFWHNLWHSSIFNMLVQVVNFCGFCMCEVCNRFLRRRERWSLDASDVDQASANRAVQRVRSSHFVSFFVFG